MVGQIGLPTERLDLQLYFSRRNELSLDGDVLLWGMRVIISKQFRAEILDELHTGHIGVVSLATWYRGIQPMLHYIHGSQHHSQVNAYILIMQVLWRRKCSSL